MPDSKPTILIVEDQSIIRLGAVALVEDAGCTAIEASNADEAIQILEARPDIRLVFTDVEMPGSMDGIKLAHFIRDRWPPVRIIVVSGRTLVDETHLPKGTRFFPKPYRDGAIAGAIISMLSSQQ